MMDDSLGVVLANPKTGALEVLLSGSMRAVALPDDVYGANEVRDLQVVDVEWEGDAIAMVAPSGSDAMLSNKIVIQDAVSGVIEIHFDDEPPTEWVVPLTAADGERAKGLLAPLTEKPTSYIRLGGPGNEGLLWPDRQNIESWIEARRRSLDDRDAASQRGQVRRKLANHFVNPYTFVPLPESADPGLACPKGPPQRHDQWKRGNLSGRIDMTWRTLSPLMVRAAERADDGGGAPIGTMVQRGDRYIIPGSSVKGAVRSLHEAIAGGCLRVLDATYVPVHRDHASTGHRAAWNLGLVCEVDGDGRPTKVQLCDEVVWTPAELLHLARQRAGANQLLQSGQHFQISNWKAASSENFGRQALTRDAQIQSFPSPPDLAGGAGPSNVGAWTILVAGTNAAREAKPFHCATGKLTSEYREVCDHAWDDYLRAVASADDCSPGDRQPITVVHQQRTIGTALGPGRRLASGQVVWVRQGKIDKIDKIDKIALSNLWRSEGQYAVSERLGTERLLPCTDPQDLCRSCQIFGSADVTGTDDGAPQHSYRSHLRFTDALAAAGTVLDEAVDLAPLGQPQPSSGQFYLTNKTTGAATEAANRPTAQWGSEADANGKRRIRGRKFYWHGAPAVQQGSRGVPRHQRRRHHKPEVTSRADLVPAGTDLTLSVTFENLRPAQLGGLLATLDPDQLFTGPYRPPDYATEQRPLALRAGGGKPFGFGSVQPIRVDLSVDTAGSRYLGEPSPSADAGYYVDTFASSTPDPIKARWRDIAAALAPDHVPAENIWYPPTGGWDSVSAEKEQFNEKFDWSFAFFAATNGRYHSNHESELAVLADPRHIDQLLPITEEPRRS